MHRNSTLHALHLRKGNNLTAAVLDDIASVLRANQSVEVSLQDN